MSIAGAGSITEEKQMNRRNFLQCLGAFAAAAFTPSVSEAIARVPDWWKGKVVVFRTRVPLIPGSYTFTAFMGDKGMYVGCVKGTKWETLFEMPVPDDGYTYERPCLSGGPVIMSFDRLFVGTVDFCDPMTQAMLARGQPVEALT